MTDLTALAQPRNQVVSSRIVSMGYNRNSKILIVEFKKGVIYRYHPVAISTYNQLANAKSIGTAFEALIIKGLDIVSKKLM